MRLFDKDALRLIKVEECAGHTIDYAAGWKACIEWIKTQPTVDAVPVGKIARLLADTFSSPCDFTPLDEEMSKVCGENCDMDDEKCWERWIKLKMDGERREE